VFLEVSGAQKVSKKPISLAPDIINHRTSSTIFFDRRVNLRRWPTGPLHGPPIVRLNVSCGQVIG